MARGGSAQRTAAPSEPERLAQADNEALGLMSRRTFILLLLIAATALLTFGAHTRLVDLILAPPPALPSLRPVPPLATVTSILSVLSKATASRVSAALASPSLANVSAGVLPAYAPLDFREQARLLALYAPFADALAELDASKAARAGELRDALAAIAVRLERHLFPWSAPLRAGLHPVLRGGRGRGIVMTTGAAHLRYALLNLRHLAALGCRLPVEVWLGTADELPAASVAELRALNATVRVMARHVDVAALRLAGYAFKPFALLLSGFDEALLLDADAYFVQEPSALYADPYFGAHGALFFPDATHPPAPPAPTRALLAALWPDAAAVPHRVAATRFFRGDSLYEQESSVVLVHRSRRALGLLGTALLNGWPARDFVYRHVLGDKETFWLGFALAGEPFDFSPHSPAILGAASRDGVVCGQMAHPDHQGKLLYWNGGASTHTHTHTHTPNVSLA